MTVKDYIKAIDDITDRIYINSNGGYQRMLGALNAIAYLAILDKDIEIEEFRTINERVSEVEKECLKRL